MSDAKVIMRLLVAMRWSLLLTSLQFSFSCLSNSGRTFQRFRRLDGGTKGRPMSRRSVDLRDQADKCRRLASTVGDAQTQEELQKVAAEYIDRWAGGDARTVTSSRQNE
jgi:hypothetical protein